MQDLSSLAAKSLATDSMHGGNQIWQRSSMSAPGGESGEFGQFPGQNVVEDAPVIDQIKHTPTVMHPEAPPMNGNPYPRFAVGGPAEWKTADDQKDSAGQAPAGRWTQGL